MKFLFSWCPEASKTELTDYRRPSRMGRGLVAGSLHCSRFQKRAHSEPPERFHPVPGEAGVWWDLRSLIFSIFGDTDTTGACFENQVSNAGLHLKGITNLGTLGK